MVNILVVDDDLSICESTKAFLEALGHTVVTANNGIEALAAMETKEFDIAIVDLFMPKSGGNETISNIKQDVPIIAVSGEMNERITPEDVSQSLQVECFMCKPFSPDELAKNITHILEKR